MSIDDDWGGASLVGKKAGRYVIVSELAADARRALYEADDVERGLRVTLGVVRANGTKTADRLRAGEKLRALNEPGLAGVLDVGTLDDGDLYIATERAVGATLRSLISGKQLDQPRALAIMRQVLEALAALHAAGAVHGDVKPENIIVNTEQGLRVKLVDVGVATLAGAAVPGDARYAAPESTQGVIDARTDLYAAGAVLFELLTGHPPFFAADAEAMRRMHAYAPVQSLKQRAPEQSFIHALEELVEMALAKKPAGRFASATDMIAVLDHALDSLEELAPPPPEPRRRKTGDSLLLLAKDLMPASRASVDVVVPVNVDRQVPELPWWTRAMVRLRRLDRRRRRIVAAVAAAIVVVVLAMVLWPSGDASPTKVDVVERAGTLVREGKADQAIALLEREVAAHPDHAEAHVALGDARRAAGRDREALAAYQTGLAAAPALGAQPLVMANLRRLAESADPQTAMAALDLIALRGGARGNEVVASQASSHPVAAVRHHAFALAERAGVTNRIDRVASWILDLEQATTCDQRRAVMAKLAGTGDARARSALEDARAHKCAEGPAKGR